jgi:hypothetical protein
MIFDDVKVGDKYLDKHWNQVLVVTKITENGFEYEVESPKRHLYPARYGPSLHTGGELFVKKIKEQYGEYAQEYLEKGYEKLLPQESK